MYTRDVCRLLLKVYMWSYNLARKGPHPYLSFVVQTNIAPLWIIRPDQNGTRTGVLLVCVCSRTFF